MRYQVCLLIVLKNKTKQNKTKKPQGWIVPRGKSGEFKLSDCFSFEFSPSFLSPLTSMLLPNLLIYWPLSYMVSLHNAFLQSILHLVSRPVFVNTHSPPLTILPPFPPSPRPHTHFSKMAKKLQTFFRKDSATQ